MKIPFSYAGFTIQARKINDDADGWRLDIKSEQTGKTVKTFKPGLQVIYLGGDGSLAYDHDVQWCIDWINRHNTLKAS